MSEKRTTYIPPEEKTINQLVRAACQQLVEQGNVECGNPEVISGLAAFLNLAIQLQAKYLNRGHDELLDSPKN